MLTHWHVLGVGAIGGLFACRLHEGGASVTLLTRHDPSSARELTVTGDSARTYRFRQQQLAVNPAEVGAEPIGHLLVTTKAWAVEPALKAVAHRLTPNSTVVLLCNGMGLAERAAPLLGDASLILASTTAGCRRASQDTLMISGEGSTRIGTYGRNDAPPEWFPQWQRGVPDCQWQSDIQEVLLAKVALNAVINPLTAIHGVENGALLNPPLSDATDRVTREVQSLLCTGGADRIAAALPGNIRRVCAHTAQNHSSMRVDIERGEPTEIEAIVGWLLKEWVADPPPTPLLAEAYEAIRAREAQDSKEA